MGRRLTDREKLLFKLDNFTDGEVSELLDYVSIMESMKREISQPDIFEDELLNLLSSARENQRAQQVLEWETARRRAESRSLPLYARR
jgi:hypothetical protein